MGKSLSELYVAVIKRSFNTRFVLSRLTRVPLLRAAIGRAFFEGDDIMILPRDEAASRIIRLDLEVDPGMDLVMPSDVLRETIRRFDGAAIMNFCICRESNACKDFPRELGCVFLGPGASRIPPRLARQVGTEEALEHVDRCQDAGLVHLIGRNKIDSVWLNTGPKEELLTICNCCPCCCLWKMLPNLDNDLGRSVTAMPGVSVKVTDACRGCGVCTEGACFVDAISVEDGLAVINAEVCRGCGRCVTVCPHHAISIQVQGDPFKESMRRLEPLVQGRRSADAAQDQG